MRLRAGEWGLFADRALVLQLAFLKERRDRALAAGTCVPIGRDRNVRSVIVTMPRPAEIRSVDSHRDHLALRANERLLALAARFGGARAAGHREQRREREQSERVWFHGLLLPLFNGFPAVVRQPRARWDVRLRIPSERLRIFITLKTNAAVRGRGRPC